MISKYWFKVEPAVFMKSILKRQKKQPIIIDMVSQKFYNISSYQVESKVFFTFGSLYLHVISLICNNLLSNNCWIVCFLLFFSCITYKIWLFILYFTPLIMSGEKIRAIFCYLWKKGLSSRAVTKKINNVEGPGNVNEQMADNCFRRFKESDTSFKDIPRSGRPFVVEDEALLEIVIHCWQNLVPHKASSATFP